MSEEFNALLANGTWSLVPKQPQFNIIGNKWVFRLKRDPDGSKIRYKACLVVKGFHQCPGIDYTETYSPITKPLTIRLVLCIVLFNGWPLCQMDVNNASLHGSISEDIYMSQLPGFVNSHFPDYIYKLHIALYGLKQAPRAWYNALKDFLTTYRFLNSRSDTSLSVYNQDGVFVYFLIYVNDLLLTGNNDSFLNAFKIALALKFSLKDLESSSFRGMKILPTSHGLFLLQHHYVHELLIFTNMQDAKPVSTPFSTSYDLTPTSNAPSCDIREFGRIIGSLQYLYLACPDVSFSVNKLSQYMQASTKIHMKAA